MKGIAHNFRHPNTQEQKRSTLDRETLGIAHALQNYEFLTIGSTHPSHFFSDP